MKTVFFFRGLNTYGNDDLQIGPFRLGSYHRHIEQDLRPYRIVPILDMGFGTLNDVSIRATSYVQGTPQWSDSSEIHFLAHSTGGLVARQVLHQLGENSKKVKSLTTLATPHKGTATATRALEFSDKINMAYLTDKFLKYDSSDRLAAYKELTPEMLVSFNNNYPDLNHINYASFAFNPQSKELHLLLKIIKAQVNPSSSFVSDGIVEYSSQSWGQELGSYPLDHLSQLGFHYYLKKSKKEKAQDNYQSMISNIKNFWHNL